MSIIAFMSLKGGVGKTSLSLNVAHAFAKRGCETLLIDTDPSAHSTRFFSKSRTISKEDCSRLARYVLSDRDSGCTDTGYKLSRPSLDSGSFCLPVRESMYLLAGGEDYHFFYWGKGAKSFSRAFPELMAGFSNDFDHIVIDTAPEQNVVSRTILAEADLVVVPVDSSAMSIDCLVNLIDSSSHIKGPQWSIVRSMVDRRASRVHRASKQFLEEQVFVDTAQEQKEPIYLLNTMVYRTEQQNFLSFAGKTALDDNHSSGLAQNYLALARELEELLSYTNRLGDIEPVFEFSHVV